jgi:hypothetical protein
VPFNTEKATQKHNGFYDYSKVVYSTATTPVEIVCPKHGSFWQQPNHHISSGRGCIKCRNDKFRGTFNVSKARSIHGDKYEYNKVVYVNSDTKVEIVCPQHGAFFQSPYKHINEGQGCERCGEFRGAQRTRLTQSEFIIKARSVHGDRFDYAPTVYVTAKQKIKILCKKHGEFQQTPDNHLSSKNGCPKCGFNVSRAGSDWLKSFDNPNIIEEHVKTVNGRRFKFDGYDPTTNTAYEYFGVFWHGHPEYTDHTKTNPRNKISFSKLYADTLDKIKFIQGAGINLVYEWG